MLRRAAAAVDRSGVSGDLRAVAFTTAVDLMLRTGGEHAPVLSDGGEAGTFPPVGPAARTALPADRPASGLDHPSTAGPFPAAGFGPTEDLGDPAWDLDESAEHRGWPQPQSPRVLRPVNSAPSARTNPRLAVRSDIEDDGYSSRANRAADRAGDRAADRAAEWAAARRGPERLVAVTPRTWATAPGASEEPWGSIADALGVRPELLDRVWEERGGKLQLAGDPARLGRTRAQRVGTAAVLLLAALRWSGRDGGEPVPDAVVRAEVERLGLLDTGNYTKHLAGRRHLLSTTGSGRTATYKLRYDGLEEARVIARALLDEA
ncbi:hypothetical protein SAMN06264364_10636 [Quadrisphaera granulorum]|uniref:Uncharacterized protein n=1 Tax=Quadrisphaera granulorum TaxID=317664 RepID=A0A316AA88_9ACTN|nr:hypothetical protein BXY45_10636 [Quadrisphaera granulorum]SZE95955.1 hypothetical protein SAMN06264364_10636 [Quadrisphaera granulorum]